MVTTPILELPPDIQLPESAAAELNMRLLWIGQQLQQLAAADAPTSSAGGVVSGQVSVIGTRNQRLNVKSCDAQNYPAAQFYETDTGLIYISAPLSGGSKGYVWKYVSGTIRTTYSNPLKSAAVFVQTLDTRDGGLLAFLTDKNRTMRWTGTNWTFAPTETIPIGMVFGFKADPGAGWHICDGSTQVQLNADGTTSNVTLDDLTSAGNKAVYPKWGPVSDGVKLAIAPTISGNTEYATTGISVSAAAAASAGGASVDIPAAGTPTNVLVPPFSGGGGGGVVTEPNAGQGHRHALASADAPISDTAEPQHYDLIPYQRI